MILVTGASGLVGSHLCRRLLSDGYQVVGLVHNRANPLLDYLKDSEHLDILGGDIRDIDFIFNIFKRYKIKTVFHTVAHLPYTLDNDLSGVNIFGTINLLYVAICYGVEEFIYASSMGIYSIPPCYLPVDEIHPTLQETYPSFPENMYGVTKRAAELSCLVFVDSMMVIILRYAGVYGLGSEENRAVNRFIRLALSGQPLIVNGDGGQSSDFVYVDDVVEGTVRAWLNRKSGIYNIGSGVDTTILKLAEMIVEITKSKSQIIQDGNEVDRPFRFFLDISKAKRDFGYSPRLLREGLKDYVEEYSRVS